VRQVEEGTFSIKTNTIHDRLFGRSKTWRQNKQPDKLRIHTRIMDNNQDYRIKDYFTGQRITAPKFNHKNPK
jgi:hypothetical protein